MHSYCSQCVCTVAKWLILSHTAHGRTEVNSPHLTLLKRWFFSAKQRKNWTHNTRNLERHDSQNTEEIYSLTRMGRDQLCLKKLLASTSRIFLLILLVKKLLSKYQEASLN